ncbi:hypothetical protein [Amycolatopsis keratiniphila]|uniref:hypothetical protein n=1 Tax=Amycolatopsis keratiniphila TaxID=129921 RepID=UPI00087B4FEB|nr:hypothetical protein [Amycolatopsis keratiniphila]SDU51820.1 hypothetical protein SAMN04489733_5350 [Amycolatopsis keratiniphila]
MSSTPDTTPHGGTSLWPVGDDGRRIVRIGEDPDAIRVLTRALDARIIPGTYVSDGAPVVVEEISGAAGPESADEDVALPLTASVLKPSLLAALLAEHATVHGQKNGRTAEVSPPGPVLSAVLARRAWPGLPVLRRIISTPVLRPDGTLLQTPGYDERTGFYLAGNTHLAPIPDNPTPDEVAAAREFLLERFLRDFPWRDPAADRANYLALLVTPLIRSFTRALSPFGLIEASMPGSGKTILTGCVGLLVGQTVQTWTESEDELRKTITTVLADDHGVIVFDNLEEGTVVNSAVLARLMTERTWSDRKLGTNTASTFANDRLWLATGNNLRTGGDMASRTVWVRLDPDCPRPEARTGFTIPNLDSWILDPRNRATVLRHILILILDWTSHGAPPASGAIPQMRQFTAWARHLGGFLEHHGIDGFLANADSVRGLDDDNAEWRSFLHAWRDVHGDSRLTAQQLRVSGEPTAGTDPWAGTFPTTPAGKPVTTKSLGRRLAGHVDRWHTDIVLRSVIDSHHNCRTYWVEEASS